MSINASFRGTRIFIRTLPRSGVLTTFPVGILVSEFADDADPIDSQNIDIADSGIGVNGTLIKWTKTEVIPVTLNLLPNGDDDSNLKLLFDNNRFAEGRTVFDDEVTLTITYPDFKTTTLVGGLCKNFSPVRGAASTGRLKSRPYLFNFQDVQGDY